MRFKVVFPALIIGLCISLLLTFSPGSLFIFLLAVITTVFLTFFMKDKEEKKFIRRLFLVGFIARVVIVLVISILAIFSGQIMNFYYTHGCPNYSTPDIIDDSGYYTLRSFYTTLYLQGVPLTPYTIRAVVKQIYGFTGFIYVLAGYFMVFGYGPISSRFINCFLGALTAVVIYFMVRRIFGRGPAKISAVLAAFFPSLFLWSVTNLKETSYIFFVYLMLLAAVKFKESRKVIYIVISLVSLFIQTFLRGGYEEVIFIGLFVIFADLFMEMVVALYKKKKLTFILFMGFLAISLLAVNRSRIMPKFELLKEKVLAQHRGISSATGSSYRLLSQDILNSQRTLTNSQFLQMVARGWLHILLEPFPWKIKTKLLLLSSPQIILWYGLLLFAVIGMVMAARYRFRESFILFLYFFFMASALGATGGNIGTIFRLRDVCTPVLLIYAGLALANFTGLTDLRKTKGEVAN